MSKWTEKTYRGLNFSRDKTLPEIREKLTYKGENVPGPFFVYDKSLGPITGK